MSPFAHLDLRVTNKAKQNRPVYELLNDFTYSSSYLKVRVPAGFETDFASVPRFFWRWFPPAGKYSKASVVHDFLYVTRKTSRWMADAIFREAMKELDVPFLARWAMWLAVRVFGPRYEVAK